SIVTLCFVASTDETTPVTSSIKSSVEDGKLLDDGGSTTAVKTLAAPRFTSPMTCVCSSTVKAFATFMLTASPMLCPRVTTSGKGAAVITGMRSEEHTSELQSLA